MGLRFDGRVSPLQTGFDEKPVGPADFQASPGPEGSSAFAPRPLPLPGPIAQDVFQGTSGNDSFDGTSGDDYFLMADGGNDSVGGEEGNDLFAFGASLTGIDHIYGGDGYDTLTLYDGDYDLTLQPFTIQSIEEIDLSAGHNYNFAPVDFNVAAGETLTINAHLLGAGNNLIWDGNDEVDGRFIFIGGAGADIFTGGNGDDVAYGGGGDDIFGLWRGGNDQVFGGSGSDSLRFYDRFSVSDVADGGDGFDYLTLSGDYAGANAIFVSNFVVSPIRNIEDIQFGAGFSYRLTPNDGMVAAGQNFIVDGASLGAGDSLIFVGSQETDGHFTMLGGAGNDSLTGGQSDDTLSGNAGIDTLIAGAGNDTLIGNAGDDILDGEGGKDRLIGGAGKDTLNGGGGVDRFIYGAAADSTGPNYDTIKNANFAADRWDVPGTITGINAAITHGALSAGQFNAKLAAAVDAAHLGAHHAVLFTPDSGTLSGDVFLIVDVNGVAGYQGAQDLVIELQNPAHIDTLSTGNFI